MHATSRFDFARCTAVSRSGRRSFSSVDWEQSPRARGICRKHGNVRDKLLDKLADRKFANVSAGLRTNLVAYYGGVTSLPASTRAQRKRHARIGQQLALLDAVPQP